MWLYFLLALIIFLVVFTILMLISFLLSGIYKKADDFESRPIDQPFDE